MCQTKNSSVLKIKKILVSQPEPKKDQKSPFEDLAKRYNLKVDFRPFIHVEEVGVKEFRKSKVNILEHTAVIFTSRTSIDHFFRICKSTRINVPETMKYFCKSEATALYLQKYIIYRKRKISYANGSIDDLITLITKNKKEKILLPVSDVHKDVIAKKLKKNDIEVQKVVLYRTVCSDLSDLANVNYDILVFYSPSGIESLFHNFPDFQQNKTKIASFGTSTTKAVKAAGLEPNIKAPAPKTPSMTMAIEAFIKKYSEQKQL